MAKCKFIQLLKIDNLLRKSKEILLLYSLNSFPRDCCHLDSYQELNQKPPSNRSVSY